MTHSVELSGRVINPTQKPLPDNTQHSQQTDFHDPGGFRSTIPATELPQTHAIDRAATGTGRNMLLGSLKD